MDYGRVFLNIGFWIVLSFAFDAASGIIFPDLSLDATLFLIIFTRPNTEIWIAFIPPDRYFVIVVSTNGLPWGHAPLAWNDHESRFGFNVHDVIAR